MKFFHLLFKFSSCLFLRTIWLRYSRNNSTRFFQENHGCTQATQISIHISFQENVLSSEKKQTLLLTLYGHASLVNIL